LNDLAQLLTNSLDQRLTDYRAGQREFNPLLALCDEFPVISLSSRNATAAANRIILEGRKVSMFALISGQGLPASTFGGTLYRDALSSRYIFRTTAQQGRLAGLDKETARQVETLEPGRAILHGPVDPPIVIAVPNTTGHDLARLFPIASRSRAAAPGRGPDYDDPAHQQQQQHQGDAPPRLERAATISDINRARVAWENGANSVRKLAEVLGVTRYQAEKLINLLGLSD
jgi:hypothetical protein